MPSDPHDLLWVAFRYVAGEMDAGETSAFEGRLSHDQAAREAVAEAVELTGAVVLASSRDPLPLRIHPRRPSLLRRVAAGVAACAALAAGLYLVPRTLTDPGASDRSAMAWDRKDEAIVLAWSGLRQPDEGSAGETSDLLAWLDEPPVAHVDAGLEPADDGGFPPWLVEAVSLRDDSQPGGSGSKEN